MFHQEIHARVRSVLQARRARGEYKILDLGCGNARLLADTLRALPPARYLGVDLSRAALDEAAKLLSALPAVELREQAMLEYAMSAAQGASFDVVYSSFAMHHLIAANKQRLFQAVATLLAPVGEFLLVDVVRAEGQSCEQYLANYLSVMRTEWRAVDPTQMEEACAHVAAYDYPETFTKLKQMAVEAGLKHANILEQFGPHHVLEFSH